MHVKGDRSPPYCTFLLRSRSLLSSGVFGTSMLIAEAVEAIAPHDGVLCTPAAQAAYLASSFSFAARRVESRAWAHLEAVSGGASALLLGGAGAAVAGD